MSLECYYLQNRAVAFGFGQRGKNVHVTRRLSRFLFFFVTLELLRRLLRRTGIDDNRKNCTKALCALRLSKNNEWDLLLKEATRVVDNYMNPGADNSVAKDPEYIDTYGSNVNAYLKSDGFAKTKEFSPGLWHWLSLSEYGLTNSWNDDVSLEQRISNVLEGI